MEDKTKIIIDDIKYELDTNKMLDFVNKHSDKMNAEAKEAYKKSIEPRNVEVRKKASTSQDINKKINRALITITLVAIVLGGTFAAGKYKLAKDIVEAKSTTSSDYISKFIGETVDENGRTTIGPVYAYNNYVFVNSVLSALNKSPIQVRAKIWSYINEIDNTENRKEEVRSMLESIHKAEDIEFYLLNENYSFLKANTYEEMIELLGYKSEKEYLDGEQNMLASIIVEEKGRNL